MRIEDLSAVLRQRNRWEAMDLGFAMVRRWWLPIYAAWLAVLLPLATTVLALCWRWPFLGILVLWWLKPWLDRIPLYILSRALFGHTPSLQDTMRALRAQFRQGALATLTWRRIDFARAFHLPVMQLEGLAGKPRRERQRVLSDPDSGGVWLTVVCVHLELIMQVALFSLVAMLFPELVRIDEDFLHNPPDWFGQIGLPLIWLVAVCIIEPFYVAAGFALYLNRRTALEAWDLEIGFRRLAERLANGGPGVAAACLVIVALSLGYNESVSAAEPEIGYSRFCEKLTEQQAALEQSASEVKQTLGRILRGDDFPKCEPQNTWLWDYDRPRQINNGWGVGFARLIEALLWPLAIVGGLILLIVLLRNLQSLRWPARRQDSNPSTSSLQGLQLEPEHFAENASSEAWRLWQSGQHRAALSLLYRASLAHLLQRHGVDFGASATEDECLRRAEHQLSAKPELVRFVGELTGTWQRLAYAHRVPADETVKSLCEQWPRHFGVTTETADSGG